MGFRGRDLSLRSPGHLARRTWNGWMLGNTSSSSEAITGALLAEETDTKVSKAETKQAER